MSRRNRPSKVDAKLEVQRPAPRGPVDRADTAGQDVARMGKYPLWRVTPYPEAPVRVKKTSIEAISSQEQVDTCLLQSNYGKKA